MTKPTTPVTNMATLAILLILVEDLKCISYTMMHFFYWCLTPFITFSAFFVAENQNNTTVFTQTIKINVFKKPLEVFYRTYTDRPTYHQNNICLIYAGVKRRSV